MKNGSKSQSIAKETTVALFGNNSPHATNSGRELTDKVMALADSSGKKQVLMVGTVNIHTQQSEHILEHIAHITKTNLLQTNVPIYNPTQKMRVRLDRIVSNLDTMHKHKLTEETNGVL